MRWQLGFIFILLGSVIGGYLYLEGIPYRKYSQYLR